MSTPGKVLVIIAILAIIGWIFLFSMVAELNTNYGKEVIRLQGDLAKLEKQLEDTKSQVATLLPQITVAQVARDKQLLVLRTELSDLEKRFSDVQEGFIRVEQQVAITQKSVEDANKALAVRQQEKVEATKELATLRGAVDTLKTENNTLLSRLNDLRKSFLSVTTENRRLLEKLANPSAKPATTARRASLRLPIGAR